MLKAIKNTLIIAMFVTSFQGQANAADVVLPVVKPVVMAPVLVPAVKPVVVAPVVRLPFVPLTIRDCDKFKFAQQLYFAARYVDCRNEIFKGLAAHAACLDKVDVEFKIALVQINLCYEFIADKNKPKK